MLCLCPLLSNMNTSVCSVPETRKKVLLQTRLALLQRGLWYGDTAGASRHFLLLCCNEPTLTSFLPLQSVHFSLDPSLLADDTLIPGNGEASAHRHQQLPKSKSSATVPELYSASHAVSKLAKTSSVNQSVDWIRDLPARANAPSLTGVCVFAHARLHAHQAVCTCTHCVVVAVERTRMSTQCE